MVCDNVNTLWLQIRVIQWKVSLLWTPNGAEESVVVSEVSSFQRLKCMQERYLGLEKVSYLERCPQLRGCPYKYRGVPLFIRGKYSLTDITDGSAPDRSGRERRENAQLVVKATQQHASQLQQFRKVVEPKIDHHPCQTHHLDDTQLPMMS